MLIIPQRLLGESFIKVYFQSHNFTFLKKELEESLIGREAYISRHAISMVMEGEQHIRTYQGEVLKVKAGELAILKRGIYSISDLIIRGEKFKSFLLFFDLEEMPKLPLLAATERSESNQVLFTARQTAYFKGLLEICSRIVRPLSPTISPTIYNKITGAIGSSYFLQPEGRKFFDRFGTVRKIGAGQLYGKEFRQAFDH